MERRKLSVPVLVVSWVLCLVLGALAALTGIRVDVGSDGIALLQAQALIHSRFVGEYDPDETRESALAAMVDSLGDRWSSYLTPEQYRSTVSARANHYVGIGITVEDDPSGTGLRIMAVTPGSPAEEAGLLPDETVLRVDGIAVTPGNREESMDRIRGEEGTAVLLEIQGTDGAVRSQKVVRREIQSVSAGWTMLEDQVALLTISNFYTGAADQVNQCLEELTEAGARALVVDVRFNPGGYVTELTEVLDRLLPEGDVFRIESYTGRQKIYTSDAACVDLPMAVLVNENTYSAAELLAAQFRETSGAPIVGTLTSGKGYAQNLYRLRDGSAVNLSNARYFTGGGVSLIGTGLVPDPYVGLSYERQAELYMGRLPQEKDGQLQAALAALKDEGRN